jgi:hypothetical protein
MLAHRGWSMVSLGTLYAHGYSSVELERIRSLGFALRPTAGTFAGAQSLRFIDFAQRPSLELIQVKDSLEYDRFVPAGMTPYCPGISLIVEPGSPTTLDDYAASYQQWSPYHLDVEEAGDGAGLRTATHYLNFATPLVERTFIYLTQYANPPPALAAPVHPNRASRVAGLVFDLPRDSLSALLSLTGVGTGEAPLANGSIEIFAREHIPSRLKDRRKTFPLVAVLVKTTSSDDWPQGDHTVIPWFGQPALLCEMNPLSWDMLLTTESST